MSTYHKFIVLQLVVAGETGGYQMNVLQHAIVPTPSATASQYGEVAAWTYRDVLTNEASAEQKQGQGYRAYNHIAPN